MNKLITILLLTSFSLVTSAQEQAEEDLKSLVDSARFEQIITEYTLPMSDYSSNDLYSIGYAHFMTGYDAEAIAYIDASIERDASNAQSHYIRGVILMYLEENDKSINSLNKAVELGMNTAKVYGALGDVYNNKEDYDASLAAYKKAIELATDEEVSARPYSMMAQIYHYQGKQELALEAYYKAKDLSDKESDSYNNILFNIGLLEFLGKQYGKAESAFLEAIELYPTDYHLYAKLIQTYYTQKKYAEAQKYKDVLYDAKKNNLIEDENLDDMFCIEQFKWKDKTIKVFERYELGPSDDIFEKLRFYIADNEDNIEYKVQTEYAPAAVAQTGSAAYFLCMWKDGTHYNFAKLYSDDSKYENIKKDVIDVLNGKKNPAASLKAN